MIVMLLLRRQPFPSMETYVPRAHEPTTPRETRAHLRAHEMYIWIRSCHPPFAIRISTCSAMPNARVSAPV